MPLWWNWQTQLTQNQPSIMTLMGSSPIFGTIFMIFNMITQYHINSPETLRSKNVQDIYKSWTNEEIIADLDKKRSELVMVYMNVTHDFNKAVAIRSGNAFAIKESYIVGGGKRYDRSTDI